MILAAGRGNRLRPLTDEIPKPMVSLCGKPLIEYHLEKLAEIGIQEVVINHAWLGKVIESGLGDGSRWGLTIHYSPEPEGGLETAGGIVNALPLLGDAPFLVVNGDVYCEYDFSLLNKVANQAEHWQTHLAHLVLVPNPEHNPAGDFGLDDSNVVTDQGDLTFAGLSVLHPDLFSGMEVDFIRLAPIFREAIAQQQISGECFEGLWSDIGTLERLQQTEQFLSHSK